MIQTMGRILCAGFIAMAWTAQAMEPNGVDPAPGSGTALVWSQPPIEIDPNLDPNVQPVFCGWDETARSTHYAGAIRQWRMVADDFPCLGPVPITHIRWWGSFKAWQQVEPPALQPVAWHIGFWMNTRSDLTADQVYLERMVWGLEIPHGRVAFEPAGINRFPQHVDVTCYRYDLALEPNEWFHQTDFQAQAEVFWISITAIYPTDAEPKYQWGWQTRPQPWRQGAQQPAILGDWPTPDMPALFPGRITPVTSALVCGTEQAYDLAFELFTTEPWIQWDQTFMSLRVWPGVADETSMALNSVEGRMPQREVADDWVYDKPDPIVAVSWYGSYLGYGYPACVCEDTTERRKPDYFLLSIYTHASPESSLDPNVPGTKIWEHLAYAYDEVLIGHDRYPEGDPNEAVFRYTVRLSEPVTLPEESVGQVLWLSVMAGYYEPLNDIPYDWGWTGRPRAFGSAAQSMAFTEEGLRVDSLYSPDHQPIDMCFTLYTWPAEPAE